MEDENFEQALLQTQQVVHLTFRGQMPEELADELSQETYESMQQLLRPAPNMDIAGLFLAMLSMSASVLLIVTVALSDFNYFIFFGAVIFPLTFGPIIGMFLAVDGHGCLYQIEKINRAQLLPQGWTLRSESKPRRCCGRDWFSMIPSYSITIENDAQDDS